MAVNVAQAAYGTLTTTNAASKTAALTGVTAGNDLYVFATYSNDTGLWEPTCSDSVNGAYGAPIASYYDATNGQHLRIFRFKGSASGNPTATVTWPVNIGYCGAAIMEISGGDGAVALLVEQLQASPGTGTDGLTSTNRVPAYANGLLVGFTVLTGTTISSPAAGTGFTNVTNGWADGASNISRLEKKTISSTTADGATFTAGSNVHHITVGLFFADAPTTGPGHPVLSPADGYAHVFRNPTLTLTFTENVQAVSGNITLKKSSDDSTIETISVTDTSKVTFASNVCTVVPATTLTYGEKYYVIVDNGAIESTVDSEDFEGIVAKGWEFTVRSGRIVLEYTNSTLYSAAGGTTVGAQWPTTPVAGARDLLIIGMKPNTSGGGSVTTPSGWTLEGSITAAGGYGGTSAADTGDCDLYVYSRDTDGTITGSLSVACTTGTNGVAWAKIIRLSKESGTWDVEVATGSDTSAGNVSITFGSDPGVTAEDLVIGAMCIPTDVSTPSQFSAQAFSQTGVTFGSVSELGEEQDSGTGNDIGGFICYARADSGTSSAAPVMTATAGGTNTNVRGPGVFVRIRAASTSALAGNPTYAAWSAAGAIAESATLAGSATYAAWSAAGTSELTHECVGAPTYAAWSAAGVLAEGATCAGVPAYSAWSAAGVLDGAAGTSTLTGAPTYSAWSAAAALSKSAGFAGTPSYAAWTAVSALGESAEIVGSCSYSAWSARGYMGDPSIQHGVPQYSGRTRRHSFRRS